MSDDEQQLQRNYYPNRRKIAPRHRQSNNNNHNNAQLLEKIARLRAQRLKFQEAPGSAGVSAFVGANGRDTDRGEIVSADSPFSIHSSSPSTGRRASCKVESAEAAVRHSSVRPVIESSKAGLQALRHAEGNGTVDDLADCFGTVTIEKNSSEHSRSAGTSTGRPNILDSYDLYKKEVKGNCKQADARQECILIESSDSEDAGSGGTKGRSKADKSQEVACLDSSDDGFVVNGSRRSHFSSTDVVRTGTNFVDSTPVLESKSESEETSTGYVGRFVGMEQPQSCGMEEKWNLDDVESITLNDGRHVFKLPGRIAASLYGHQREGIKWLWGLHCKGKGGILGDDMGLGKTMQVCAFLAGLFSSRLIKCTMIVAPKTLVAHWFKELSSVGLYAKTKDYSGAAGSGREHALRHVLQDGGILLTTYDVVRNNWKTLRGDLHGRDGYGDTSDDIVTWDYMILDEGHLIKNPSTQRSKSLREIPTGHHIVVSGTPIQNNLREMWALFDFCCPQLLGDKKEFKARYEDAILRANNKDATDRQKRIGSTVAQELRKRIAPFFLRRLKSEVFPTSSNSKDQQLARKNDVIVWLTLTDCQRQLYTAFLESEAAHLSLDGSALAALTVLKKICDHPALLTKKATDDIAEGMEAMLGEADAVVAEAMTVSLAGLLKVDGDYHKAHGRVSCKLIFIMTLLEKLVEEGHRTLIFAQTRKMLNIIQMEIVERGYSFRRIDGTMKASERENHVQNFQGDNAISIFLLTSQVGGLGLTLTGADRVIIVDPAWNPSTDNQSVDRAYRIGQLRDVLVYRLMTCGTIEEKIYRKQVFKGGLFKVATEHKEQMRYFCQQELRELLTLPETGFDISLTQKQLYEEHGHQNEIDQNLRQHIKFLEGQGIAGVSHHDLLFSKQAPEVPSSLECESVMESISKKINSEGAVASRFKCPTVFNKREEKRWVSHSGNDDASREWLRILSIKENINRLSLTLADQITVSKLPDQGENIKRKIRDLTNELNDAEQNSLIMHKSEVLQTMQKQVQKAMAGPFFRNDNAQQELCQRSSSKMFSAKISTVIDVDDMLFSLGKLKIAGH